MNAFRVTSLPAEIAANARAAASDDYGNPIARVVEADAPCRVCLRRLPEAVETVAYVHVRSLGYGCYLCRIAPKGAVGPVLRGA